MSDLDLAKADLDLEYESFNASSFRINYPLQLGYQGKHDPINLLNTIKELKIKLSDFERQDVGSTARIEVA